MKNFEKNLKKIQNKDKVEKKENFKNINPFLDSTFYALHRQVET